MRCAVAALAAAAATALASAPVEWTWTPWVFLVPLLWSLDGQSGRRSFLIGWAAGAGANLALFTWLGLAFRDYGELHPIPALLAFGVYVAFGGLQYAWLGLADWTARTWWTRGRLALFPCAFVGVELLWPRLFPWHLSTPLAIHPLLIQIAEWGGQLSLTFVIAAFNCGLWALLAWWRAGGARGAFPRYAVGMACALLAGTLAYGGLRLADVREAIRSAETLRISVVQPNTVVSRRTKTDAETVQRALLDGAKKARRAVSELTVYSEGAAARPAIDVLPPASGAERSSLDQQLHLAAGQAQRDLRALARAAGGPVLVGLNHYAVRAESPTATEILERHNVLLLLGADGQVQQRYEKHVLLPFAEYLPGEQTFPWLRDVLPLTGQMNAGDAPRLLTLGERKIAPLICYEAVSPAVVRGYFSQEAPDLLVNATNDIWFRGQGPHLHRMIVLWRAVETRRPLVRATSTGLSVVVFPDGSLHAETQAGEGAVETLDVPLPELGVTPYTRYGELFGWVVVLLGCGLVLHRRRRAARED